MHIGPFPSTIFQNSLHHFSTFRNFPFSVLSVLSNYLVEKSSVGRTLFVLSITDFLTTLNMTSITTPDAPTNPLTSRHVAVIGGGAAGLAAARELVREGHRVVVFERGDQVGGTWVYNPKVESDQLGLDPRRAVVHSSLYESLRTNLPREIMGFRDFPFVAREDDQDRDPRRFPSHREVLMYLKEFAKEFAIEKWVRFETEVVYVGMVKSNGNFNKWKVRSKKRSGDEIDEFFDAVVVCAGHYTEPRVAEIPGIQAWPGKQIHSHSYRIPEPFRDQVVVLIGSSASGGDISRDLVGFAKEVHVASRTIADEKIGKHPGYDNMWLHSMIKSVHRDGSVIFHDGSVVFADVILHCTGYKYHFPFLETNGTVTVDDNRVGPLYKHVFPPNLAPWLSFVGVPMKLLPFPHWELQSKWIAGVLSDRISLPFEDDMMEDVTSFYSMLEVSGTPKRHTHYLDFHSSEYGDWLAVQSGCPSFEEWRKQMLIAVAKRHIHQPDTYRDQWDDEDLILQAHQDFIKYFPNKVNK